jgi:PAS domain S-box-containing protein
MTKALQSDVALAKELEVLKNRIATLEEINNKNIQEREELEKKLYRYELAVNGSNDGLWDWDLISNEAFVSKPWKEMLGYGDDEIPDQDSVWGKLLHPEDLSTATQAIKSFIDGDVNSYNIEFRVKHKDNSYRWINSKGTILRDSNGKAYRISGSDTDITSRRLSEEDLRKNEQKYKNLFENSLVGMFRANIETGKILEANNKALGMFGLKAEEFTSTLDIYADLKDREEIIEKLKTIGLVENKEVQFIKKDGTLFWASFSGTYYKNGGFAECVVNDITHTKETLTELQKVNFELDNFVYHASHDLRSPLRSILGLVTIMRMEQDPKEKENCVDMIEGSIKRLDNLVTDLLSISRNNRVNDKFEKINFMLEVSNSVSNFYHVSDTKDLEIICKVKQPVAFFSDMTRVRIVLNNLISNAIKYRSYDRERYFVNITAEVDEEKAVVIIEDNGEGIPDEKLPKVFDMFFRATESSEGSGLGLYIVKNVLEKLKGKVNVISKENVGTTFSFEIPNGKSES